MRAFIVFFIKVVLLLVAHFLSNITIAVYGFYDDTGSGIEGLLMLLGIALFYQMVVYMIYMINKMDERVYKYIFLVLNAICLVISACFWEWPFFFLN